MSKIKKALHYIFRGNNDFENEPDMFEAEGYYSQSSTYSEPKYDFETSYNAAREFFRVNKKVDRDKFLINQDICSVRDMQKILGILYREKKITVHENGIIEYIGDLPEKQSLENQVRAELLAIDNMEGFVFERYTCQLLLKIGFSEAYTTQKSVDYGVDVIAVKDNVKYAIQCKRYAGKVGNKAVQEISAGLSYYKAQRGIVLTNSYYTENAVNLAKANNVILWNRKSLYQLIEIKLKGHSLAL